MSVRGILLDTVKNTIKIKTINGDLNSYYDVLNCDCFDVPMRRIGGKYYSIYCDDEGLLKGQPVVSAVTSVGEPMLVGNLFICSDDGEGGTIGLEDDDISRIAKEIRQYISGDLKIRKAIVMEY